jgi:hypothetical protein
MGLASLLLHVDLLHGRGSSETLLEHTNVGVRLGLGLLANLDLSGNLGVGLAGDILLALQLAAALIEILLLVDGGFCLGVALCLLLRRALVALAHAAAATAGIIAHGGHGSTQESGKRKDELHDG